MSVSIGLVTFDRFTDLDFFLPWDLLNRVRLLNLVPGWNVQILCDKSAIRSAAGLEIVPTKPYEFAGSCDGVFFTSGPETRNLVRDAEFLGKFRLDPASQVIAAIDSGALIPAALGLLSGKKAVTYPTARELLESFGVTFEEEAFVEDGGIATGARCMSGDRLAFWMIEKLSTPQAAAAVAETVSLLGRE